MRIDNLAVIGTPAGRSTYSYSAPAVSSTRLSPARVPFSRCTAIALETAARLTGSGQSGSHSSTPSDQASQGSMSTGQSAEDHSLRIGMSTSCARAASRARSNPVAFGGSSETAPKGARGVTETVTEATAWRP